PASLNRSSTSSHAPVTATAGSGSSRRRFRRRRLAVTMSTPTPITPAAAPAASAAPIVQSNEKPSRLRPATGAPMAICAVPRGAVGAGGVVGADGGGVVVAGADGAEPAGVDARAPPGSRLPPGRSLSGVGSKRVQPTPASQTSPQAWASSDVTL